MGESVKVKVEYEASGSSVTCRPQDYLDCESEEDLYNSVVEAAEETATWGAYPSRYDIATLWAAVQKLREREG